MYIHREIEKTVDYMLTQGKVVLVTGARQVGKTTMLKHHLGKQYNYVTMDNPAVFFEATQDSLLFFRNHELPLIIDEVQKVPQLFDTVKYLIDQSEDKGRIVLTGSQTYHLMKGVSESLAGRIRIIQMSGLSLREINGQVRTPQAYVPSEITMKKVATEPQNIWQVIHRGSMPELQNSDIEWDVFYTDYVRAYLERDVRDLINVKDETRFYNFMVACAARTGKLFNASDIGKTIGIDHKTTQSWLSVLEASGIVHILQPFWSNTEKRLAKTPKIFFMDTGLVCHLTRWNTPEQLERGAAAGHIFETFAVSEILKSHMNAGVNLKDVYFYRDSKKREIDLVIQQGRTLHPVEVKTAVTVGKEAVANFDRLEQFKDYEVGFGHLVCQTETPYFITDNVQAVPVWAV